MVLQEIKDLFYQELSEQFSESEIAELFIIFSEKILNQNRIEIRTVFKHEITSAQADLFKINLEALKSGKPFQQILGETEFYGFTFFVDENVLIPRPETEELLEFAISKLHASSFRLQSFKILDIGTGSGIIPIILKKHFPKAEITAIDISEKALETAQKNADFHQTEIRFLKKDFLTDSFDENFDIIISNPPYIGIDEENEIADSVKEFEPKIALFSPVSDTLIFYRKIAALSENRLNENGMVFLEINQKMGKETLELFKQFQDFQLIKDISGNDRIVFAQK